MMPWEDKNLVAKDGLDGVLGGAIDGRGVLQMWISDIVGRHLGQMLKAESWTLGGTETTRGEEASNGPNRYASSRH